MWSICIIVVIRGLSFLLISEKQHPASAIAQTSTLSNAELQGIVDEANKNYPKTLETGIRIDKMTSGNQIVTYHKVFVGKTVDDFNPVDPKVMHGLAAKEICKSAARGFIDKGVAVENIYRDKNGVVVHQYAIRKADCV
jgi:hypothetical protein